MGDETLFGKAASGQPCLEANLVESLTPFCRRLLNEKESAGPPKRNKQFGTATN